MYTYTVTTNDSLNEKDGFSGLQAGQDWLHFIPKEVKSHQVAYEVAKA